MRKSDLERGGNGRVSGSMWLLSKEGSARPLSRHSSQDQPSEEPLCPTVFGYCPAAALEKHCLCTNKTGVFQILDLEPLLSSARSHGHHSLIHILITIYA